MSVARDPDPMRALLARAVRRIEELEARMPAASEPIAVVGLGCRFPGGADSPAAFWRLLMRGEDAIREVPPDRWDAAALYDADPDQDGRIVTRNGGFLEAVDQFDAGLFGISPREADRMDPQQRLALEVAWETLEHAAIAPDRLRNTRGGVFIGASAYDYLTLLCRDPAALDGYFGTGNAASVIAGRIAYQFGLTGPAIAIDTACSSSLVAVHLARRSLLAGECDLAFAGGVNLILAPHWSINFSRARMLSPDGRCKAFDAAADGYGRGEGCGLVLLKRLSDARRDGDDVLALIAGSAVNQDGRSAGLTAPNGPAQQAVISAALAEAGLPGAVVTYVEAHGTGTPLGDPIEVQALAAALRPGGGAEKLRIGTVKSNIGHLEAAAGIAGLIKLALALRHGALPTSLHLRTPNPRIDWDRLPVRVQAEASPWPAGPNGGHVGAVSSFGFSGTNAHVVLRSADPAATVASMAGPRPMLLRLSAGSEPACARLARSWAGWLTDPNVAPGWLDACATAALGRAHLQVRLAVVADDCAGAASALTGDDALRGVMTRGRRPHIVFLFTGQGSLHPGMAAELYRSEPVFAAVIDRCDALLGGTLLRVLQTADAAALVPTRVQQPVLFALQSALVALWRSWGVTPDAAVGHSIGELAAAAAAGVFGLDSGLRLAARRGALMDALPAGAMAAAFADAETVESALVVDRHEVAIAAYNAPDETLLSGPADALGPALERLAARGVRTRTLPVSHAFHAPGMAAMLPEWRVELADVAFAAPGMELVPTAPGTSETMATAEYWCAQVVAPVRFADALGSVAAAGAAVFVEIGPRPVLTALARRVLGEAAVAVSSLRPGTSDRRQMLSALAQLYVTGAVDTAGPPLPEARRTAAPTMEFDRHRHWAVASALPLPLRAWGAKPTKYGGRGSSSRRCSDLPTPPPALGPLRGPSPQGEAETGALGTYYRDLAARHSDASPEQWAAEQYLHFFPFRAPEPGFSWVKVVADPASQRHWAPRLRQAQDEVHAALFRNVALDAASRVADIGCGYATDLIDLARAHPHLQLDGYTISADQVIAANARANALGLSDRVRVHLRDTARDALAHSYDLMLSLQVAHHIADKPALFANMARHLVAGGVAVFAEVLADGSDAVADPASTAFFSPREAWAAWLAEVGFQVVEAIDASTQIANYLHDPDFPVHLTEALARRPGADPGVRAHLTGPHRLGTLLRRGIVRYLLLTVQHAPHLHRGRLLEANAAQLAGPTRYGDEPAIGTRGLLSRRTELLALPPPDRPGWLVRWLIGRTAAARGTVPHEIDPFLTLPELGVDSLVSLELRHRIDKEFGVTVTAADLLGAADLHGLAASIAAALDAAPMLPEWEEAEL
jgi:acyl transferase domain-containing protein